MPTRVSTVTKIMEFGYGWSPQQHTGAIICLLYSICRWPGGNNCWDLKKRARTTGNRYNWHSRAEDSETETPSLCVKNHWDDSTREARPAPTTTCPKWERQTAFRSAFPTPRSNTAVKPQDWNARTWSNGKSRSSISGTGETWETELRLRHCELLSFI